MSDKVLFVFDFDQTITDTCTESLLMRLCKHDLAAEALAEGWSYAHFQEEVTTTMMREHVTEQRLREALQADMRLTEGIQTLLDYIRERPEKFDCIIISDANSFFISTLLRHLNLEDAFDRVFTNPARFTADGRFEARPCHQHEHAGCPTNMCKRKLLALFVDERHKCGIQYRCIRYVGDGGNDYCPGEALDHADNLYVRKGKELDAMLAGDRALRERLRARVVVWKSSIDILEDVKAAR